MYNLYIIISIIVLGIICLCYEKHSKNKNKNLVPNITMSEDQEKIVTKLRKINISIFENNLWNNTCPLCGKDMNSDTYGGFDQYSDHWCTHCGFITKMEVLV